MMSNFKRSSLFLLTGILLLSCASNTTMEANKGSKIGEVNGNALYFSEVWDAFNRSNSALKDSITLENFTNFSNLYLDFKTKLAASSEAGYFTDSSIVSELANYEEQFALPFWLEKEIQNQLLDEFVDRSNFELEVSHMLISILPNDRPEDTLKVYNTLLEAREKALKGADFDSLSLKVSSTRDGRSMGGPLGWMSAGWAVKPFEDVAFQTKPGEISKPFMTQFGMHVLIVRNKRPRSWDRFISHVFWRSGGDQVKQDSVIQVANHLREEILSGKTPWDSAVVKYSEDGLSKANHGNIGWTTFGRYYPVFNDTMFSIKQIGGIAKAFYSGYGVHLIKLDSIKSFGSEEEKRAELLTKLKSLPRFKNSKEATYARLRAIAKAKQFADNADKVRLYVRLDSNKSMKFNAISLPKNISSLPVFTMKNKSYTNEDYFKWLQTTYPNQLGADHRYQLFDRFVEDKTAEFLVPMTKEQFPEYKKTTDEYLNGLVVFRISEDSVWNYVKTDTVNLKKVFNSDSTKYWFEKRYQYYRVSSSKDSLLLLAKKDLESGLSYDSVKSRNKTVFILDDMISDITEDPYYRLGKIKDGQATEIFELKKRQTFLFLKETLNPRQMTFDEAIFRVIADYQPLREKSWIKFLKEKYKSSLNTEVLEKSFNEKKTRS